MMHNVISLQACNRGNRGVVRVLLEFGADLNLKGFAKDSPLHDAARNGHIKVKAQYTMAGPLFFNGFKVYFEQQVTHFHTKWCTGLFYIYKQT